jgi:hypothetical protein
MPLYAENQRTSQGGDGGGSVDQYINEAIPLKQTQPFSSFPQPSYESRPHRAFGVEQLPPLLTAAAPPNGDLDVSPLLSPSQMLSPTGNLADLPTPTMAMMVVDDFTVVYTPL